MDGPDGQGSRDGREGGSGDVAIQQADGAEPAGAGELGQRGGQRDPGAQPHRGVERGGDDGGHAEALGQSVGATHTAERRNFEDGDIDGAAPGDGQRVGGQADGLVGGDGDVDDAAQGDQIGEIGAGLLDVLQPPCGLVEQRQNRGGGPRIPGAVGVDADAAFGPEFIADGPQSLDIGIQAVGVGRACDLHLGGIGPGSSDKSAGRLR